MYFVESYLKNGASFMEYQGMDKVAFCAAWDDLSEEEKADIDRITFTEFEGVEAIDDIYDPITCKRKCIATRKNGTVQWSPNRTIKTR